DRLGLRGGGQPDARAAKLHRGRSHGHRPRVARVRDPHGAVPRADAAMSETWQFWVDRGGTFTDCIGRDPATGELRVVKVLSSDDAPIEGIRQLLSLGPEDPLPVCTLRLGTT